MNPKTLKRRRLANKLLQEEHGYRIDKRPEKMDQRTLAARLAAVPKWYWTWRPLMHVCIPNERDRQSEAQEALARSIRESTARLSIIVGVSGAGKQGMMEHVLTELPLTRFVLLNTRAPRTGDIESRQFDFVEVPELQREVDIGRVLAEEVYGTHWVGVCLRELEDVLRRTRCILECPARLALELADRYPARLYFVTVYSDVKLWQRVDERLKRWSP